MERERERDRKVFDDKSETRVDGGAKRNLASIDGRDNGVKGRMAEGGGVQDGGARLGGKWKAHGGKIERGR